MRVGKFTSSGSIAATALAVVAVMCLFVAQEVRAEERIHVPMEDMEVTHDDDVKTIKIRGQIRKMRGEFNAERYELAFVTIIAKSRKDNARAWVVIDPIEGDRVKIEGNVDNYKSDKKDSYSRYRMPLPSPKIMSGKWTLNMKGRMKISRIIIGLNDCGEGECRIQQVENRRVIPLDDSEVRVPESERMIDLKKLVENYDGDIKLNEASLVKVEALVKIFERDGAYVRLLSADQKSVQTSLTGGRDRYRSRRDDTFTRVELAPRDPSKTNGKWELGLRKGTFKLREIAVTTVDRAYWRSDARPLAPPSDDEKKVADKKDSKGDGKKTGNKQKCDRGKCKPSRSVQARAGGALSCYASGDGRQIDRRDGAKMTFVQGCSDGTCMKSTETCYESRTCKCADGSGRCTDKSSCGSGSGCQHGYVSLKFHCPSGIFDG